MADTVKTKKKLILKCFLSPGDILMMTACVRDLHKAHGDKYLIDVRTSCMEIWENNPYISKIQDNDPDARIIDMQYPLIHRSNTSQYHFIHGYRLFLEEVLGISIPPTDFKGDIHISRLEKSWYSTMEEIGFPKDEKFWIINAGTKDDYTAKWWNPQKFQKVVDAFSGKITFVQVGAKEHIHPMLKGVVNLVGKTDNRQLIRLVYHSSGVLCGTTYLMHLAAAVEMKYPIPKNRSGVILLGAREPFQWEAYPHFQNLALNGCLPCADNGGCWKSRCTLIGDKDKKDSEVCLFPVETNQIYLYKGKSILYREPKCLNMISVDDVIRAIDRYYSGGVLEYGSSIPRSIPTAAKEFVT